MEASVPFAVSENCEKALYSSPDGVLKLWEVSSGNLRQEYTPSAHLSATCTCLSWGSRRGQVNNTSASPRLKKKRKSKQLKEEQTSDLVAVGTTAGNILIYNARLADIQTQLDGGHTDRVNAVAWNAEDNSLLSCSNDHFIVHWDVPTNKIKHKWKGDKSAVYSLSLCSSKHLLSAGRTIKLWNIESYELLKKYTGHATEVMQLLPIPCSPESIDNTYFLSSAQNDRVINAWQVDSKSSSNRSSVASFSLPDEPSIMDVSQPSLSEQRILLCVVSKAGQVLVFEHTLNGKLVKPVDPSVTLQIATSVGKSEIPRPLPVMFVKACGDKDLNILLVYGNLLQPKFEKWAYSNKEQDVCLIREDIWKLKLKTENNVTKIKTPEVSKDMTVLVPEMMASKKLGRKRKSSVSADLSLEERLSAIGMEAAMTDSSSAAEAPRTDSMVKLLLQGLQSQDRVLINKVLYQPFDSVRENTVRRLPVQFIVPLIKVISQRLMTSAKSSMTLVKWIKSVLAVHSSYLMTFPDVVELFSSMYQIMDTRTLTFRKMSKMHGKLELILTQITSRTDQQTDQVSEQPALLMYQEDSSDEDLDDFVVSQSETEVDDNIGLFDDNGKEEDGKEEDEVEDIDMEEDEVEGDEMEGIDNSDEEDSDDDDEDK